MGVLDCPKCWNVLCSCGWKWWQYQNWDEKDIAALRDRLAEILAEKKRQRSATMKLTWIGG